MAALPRPATPVPPGSRPAVAAGAGGPARSRPPRRAAARLAAACLAAALALALAACVAPPPEGAPERISLSPARFADLPGWAADSHAAAVPPLRAACARIGTLPDAQPLGVAEPVAALAGTVAEWRQICAGAALLPAGDDAAARAFFETSLAPYRAQAGEPWEGRAEGLVTGYFEPEYTGSRRRGARFPVPVHGRPGDLVEVDLGAFRPALAGQRIAGRLDGNGRLVPYPDRAAIAREGLGDRAPVLAWLADPADLFFLQVQGSGRVTMAEGGTLRLGYAASNGHPYVAIGRVLVERGALAPEQVSMASIRAWLAAHPTEARALLDANPSYIFFRELRGLAESDGPLGAFGVPLAAGRSVAVDRAYVPLGVPLWLATADPDDGSPIRRLVMALDIGGAIRGPLRADLYWGTGEAAGRKAGAMRAPGQVWLLLPRRGPPEQQPPAPAAATAPTPPATPEAAPAAPPPATGGLPSPPLPPGSHPAATPAASAAAPPAPAAPAPAAPAPAASATLPLPPRPPARR